MSLFSYTFVNFRVVVKYIKILKKIKGNKMFKKCKTFNKSRL